MTENADALARAARLTTVVLTELREAIDAAIDIGTEYGTHVASELSSLAPTVELVEQSLRRRVDVYALPAERVAELPTQRDAGTAHD